MLKILRKTLLAFCIFLILSKSNAQNQVALPQTAPQKEVAKPSTNNPSTAMSMGNQVPSKEDLEQRNKMGELNKQIQEAEKAGNGSTPETLAKKEEFKKMQEQLRAKMMAENEKRKKENEAVAAKNNEANQKIIQLNKEIKEAEAAGKGETPEIVAKKTELKKLQDEKDAKMKADRDKMMKDRPQMSKEDMEANKKMGQLNKEIRDAEKEGKGETPEVVAKKGELKKMQEVRIAKMKAEREKAKASNSSDNKQTTKPSSAKEVNNEQPSKK